MGEAKYGGILEDVFESMTDWRLGWFPLKVDIYPVHARTPRQWIWSSTIVCLSELVKSTSIVICSI